MEDTAAKEKAILVADDDEDIRALVTYRFKQAGFSVFEARDGEEALNHVGKSQIDLAVLDVRMPKLDGLELTKKIREGTSKNHNIPIILLSASVQDANIEDGLRAGANDYMKKPFSPNELLLRVQTMLGRST